MVLSLIGVGVVGECVHAVCVSARSNACSSIKRKLLAPFWASLCNFTLHKYILLCIGRVIHFRGEKQMKGILP